MKMPRKCDTPAARRLRQTRFEWKMQREGFFIVSGSGFHNPVEKRRRSRNRRHPHPVRRCNVELFKPGRPPVTNGNTAFSTSCYRRSKRILPHYRLRKQVVGPSHHKAADRCLYTRAFADNQDFRSLAFFATSYSQSRNFFVRPADKG